MSDKPRIQFGIDPSTLFAGWDYDDRYHLPPEYVYDVDVSAGKLADLVAAQLKEWYPSAEIEANFPARAFYGDSNNERVFVDAPNYEIVNLNGQSETDKEVEESVHSAQQLCWERFDDWLVERPIVRLVVDRRDQPNISDDAWLDIRDEIEDALEKAGQRCDALYSNWTNEADLLAVYLPDDDDDETAEVEQILRAGGRVVVRRERQAGQ